MSQGQGREADPGSRLRLGTPPIFSCPPWPSPSSGTRAPAQPPYSFPSSTSLLPPLHYRLPSAELLMVPDYPGVWEMTTTAAPPSPPPPGCPPPPGTSQPTTNLYPRLMLGAGRQVGREEAEDKKAEEGTGSSGACSISRPGLGPSSQVGPVCLGLGRAV